MAEQNLTIESVCSQRGEIGAYLDCELTSSEELALEAHLAVCNDCLAEMNAQKRMLSTLSVTRDEKADLPLPKNFAKVVAVRAESGVTGLRSKEERFNAAFFCAALFFVLMIGLSVETGNTPQAFSHFGERAFAVLNFLGHTVHDFGVGVAVIIRSLLGQLVFGSALSFVIVAVLFAFSATVLSNLIFRSNRS